LIDTSVWVEFLNARPGAAQLRVRELAEEPSSILTTEPVLMELWSGTTGEQLVRTERVLDRFGILGVYPALDFRTASDLYRGAKRHGCTVRSMVDCLIAAVALRNETVLLHRDRDFDVLAEVAPKLRCESTTDS
jgi:hypothetical protein